MPRPSSLRVPKGDATSPPNQPDTFTRLADLESLVVVGANGSGKSRFGYAIEQANQSLAPLQRISAQRALEVPESVAPEVVDKAEKDWYYGRSDQHAADQRRANDRWRSKPITGLLNDYDRLMKLVFAKTNERNHVFTKSHIDGEPLDAPPESPSGKVERVWATVFPHREILFESGKVMANANAGQYNASEMSDGERVALYLMASVFVAPEESVLVIDEPEIHLHRSIRDSVFDSLEAERSDCLFVYLTHDVEFATSRPAATRIWLKEYSGQGWLWEPLQKAEGLPTTLVAELLGSRRPVLFVEGELDSLDTLLYSVSYPERYVVAVGSCGRVIQFTIALNGAPQLHHLRAEGIVDRDRRTDEEVASLQARNVHVLSVAEIENVIIAPEVLASISDVLGFGEAEVETAKEVVLQRLDTERVTQINEHVSHRVRKAVLRAIDAAPDSATDLQAALEQIPLGIDVAVVSSEIESVIDNIISESDYDGALMFFNSKQLVRHISQSVFHMGAVGGEDGLSNFVRRHLHSNTSSEMINSIREVLPELTGDET